MSLAAISIIFLISPRFSGHADTLWTCTHSARRWEPKWWCCLTQQWRTTNITSLPARRDPDFRPHTWRGLLDEPSRTVTGAEGSTSRLQCECVTGGPIKLLKPHLLQNLLTVSACRPAFSRSCTLCKKRACDDRKLSWLRSYNCIKGEFLQKNKSKPEARRCDKCIFCICNKPTEVSHQLRDVWVKSDIKNHQFLRINIKAVQNMPERNLRWHVSTGLWNV